MKNYGAPGDSVRVTAPYAVTPGTGMLIGSLFCVATKTAALGELTDAVTEGQFDLPAVSAETAAEGAVAYWDAANSRVSFVTGTPIGTAPGGKANGVTDVRVRLQSVAGAVSNSGVSSKCVLFVPTLQQVGSGAARDLSGNGHDFALGTAVVDDGSGLWSDTSREFNALAKIPNSASGANYLYVPSLTTVWDLSEWFIFSAIIQPTVAPQARNLVACAIAGTAAGWYLKGDTNGKLYVVIINDALGVGGNIASTPVLLTSGKRSVITVAVDPAAKDIFLYVNGVLVDQWLNSWTGAGASTRFLTTATNAVTANNTSVPTYGMLLGGIHYYKGAGALPSNHAALAQRLAALPFSALATWELE